MKARRSICRFLPFPVLILAGSLASYTAQAADGTWISDANGIWDTASNWSALSIADGTGFTADFSSINITGDRTVSLDSPRVLGNLIFGDTVPSSAFNWILDDNGNPANTLTLDAATPTITVNTLGTNKTANISAVLDGLAGLTKAGSGALTLSGANTYSGTTTIQSGILLVTGSLNGTSGTDLNFSGTGVFNVSEASGVSQGMGALTLSAGDATVQSTNNGGNSFLSFTSLGTLATGVTANLAVSGGTNGTDNKISFTTAPATAQLLDTGLFFNGSNYAAYDASGFARAYTTGDTNHLSVAGGATLGSPAAAENVVITGNITAQPSVVINTLNLGTNSLTMSAGGEILKTDGVLSSGTNAATLGFTGTTGILQPATEGGEIVVRVNGAADKLTLNALVQNNVSASTLTKTGTGTLVLGDSSSNNTYSGGTFLNAGTVQLGVAGGNGARQWFGPGLLTMADGTAITSVNDPSKTISSPIHLSAGAASITSRDITVSGKVSGPGSLIITAAGRWLALTNTTNDFTGGIIFRGASANTLIFGSPAVLSSGPIRAEANSILQPNAPMSSGLGVTNPVIITQGATLTTNVPSASPLLLSGAISGGGTLSKSSPGTLILTGTNIHTGGTTVTDGILTVAGSGTFGAPTGNLTASGGNLDLAGGTFNAGTVTISGGIIQNGNLTGTSYAGQRGFVSANLGGAGTALTMNSSNNRLVLSGTNTYGGATNITNGTLLPTQAAALPNYASGPISVAANGTLQVNAGQWSPTEIAALLANPNLTFTAGGTFAIDTTDGDFANSTNISIANLGVKKLGANTLTITGNNSYTGKTTVNAGTVTVDAGAGAVLSASSGVTFSGTSTFNYDNTTATEAKSQNLGVLTFSAGEGTVQLTRSALQPVSLTFSSLAARTVGATRNFVLAGTPGVNGTDSSIILTGQGAGFIDHGSFFGGTAYAWMDAAGTFVRGMNYDGTEGITSGGGVTLAAATHQQVTGAITAQESATFNTLNIAGDHNFTLNAGATLTVNGILKTGNNGSPTVISGGTGINTTSNGEMIIRTAEANDSLTLNTPVLANGTSSLTKTGAGTLTLAAANTLTSGVRLNAGQLNINHAGALGTEASPLTINEGTTLDNTSGGHIAIPTRNPITINGSFTYIGTSGDLSFPDDSGVKITLPNNVAINILNNTLKLTYGTTSSINQSSITKNGPGTLWIGTNGNANYTGGLIVNAGVVTGNQQQANQIAGTGPITLGATSGSANAIIASGANISHGNPITVRAGSTGILAIASYNSTGSWGGPVTLNNNLTLSGNGGNIDMSGPISGSGGIIVGNTGSYVRSNTLTKSLVNTGTVSLYGVNTATGAMLVNSGTLRLGPVAAPGSAALVSVAAGGTLDVTLNPSFALGGATTLAAQGTGTGTGTTAARIQGASAGTVNLGAQPISLTFTPTAFTGDTTHPSLLISQGSLTLNNNAFSVNNASGTPLDLGVYRLIQVANNTVIENGSPSYPVTVTGSGLAANTSATVSVVSGQVIMTVEEGVSDPYTTWAASMGLVDDDAAAGADPDLDGLNNLLEFVLGGQPNPANGGSNSVGLLPSVSQTSGNLLFTFRRSDLSLTQPGILMIVEYGSDLSGWTTAQHGVDGVTITPFDDFFDTGIDKVEVSIPQALSDGAKLFARLRILTP